MPILELAGNNSFPIGSDSPGNYSTVSVVNSGSNSNKFELPPINSFVINRSSPHSTSTRLILVIIVLFLLLIPHVLELLLAISLWFVIFVTIVNIFQCIIFLVKYETFRDKKKFDLK